MNIEELRSKITRANEAYRLGKPIISDFQFDTLVDELTEINPHDELLLQIGFVDEKDSRKEALPIEMASMNKVKTVADLVKWCELKGIPQSTVFILTPKYDGASLCVKEYTKQAWTRGNGVLGQRSDIHLKVLNQNSTTVQKVPDDFITVGEVILPKFRWNKYSDEYANARNMVAGQLNSDVPGDELADCVYIRYGTNYEDMDKLAQLEICNKLNIVKVPYKLVTIERISEEFLKQLFEHWGKEFTLDGIIIEVGDKTLRQNLGRERNGNPAYARAYKGNFEEIKETTVKNIEWNVSKQGYLKPVANVEPVVLDGATVTRVTLCNAKSVEWLRIGKGSKILVKRSGQVIPFLVSVLTETPDYEVPTKCVCCKSKLTWNETKVELVCLNDDCESKRLQKIISFFNILEVENVGEGVLIALYCRGYDTVKKILDMSKKELLLLEGFGEKKADIVYNSIHSKMKDVSLSKLQHASGVFKILGSKKLALLEGMYELNPLLTDIWNVEGFAERSAKDYLQGIVKFREFIKGLPITIQKKVEPTSDKYKGMVVVFTGFRNKDWEELLIENGALVGSSVSKNTTHLVMKEKGSGSSKEQKALTLGVKIWDITEMNEFFSEK